MSFECIRTLIENAICLDVAGERERELGELKIKENGKNQPVSRISVDNFDKFIAVKGK